MELLIPKLDEVIPALIAFVIVVGIIAKYGAPALLGMLDKRRNKIKSDLERAEEAKIEGERTLAEYKEQLAQARQEASTIVAEAKQSGEAIRVELSQKAQAEADQIVSKARGVIESEKKAAIAELQGSVADLTVAVTARVIGEDLSEADHRKLIERYVAEAGNLDG